MGMIELMGDFKANVGCCENVNVRTFGLGKQEQKDILSVLENQMVIFNNYYLFQVQQQMIRSFHLFFI